MNLLARGSGLLRAVPPLIESKLTISISNHLLKKNEKDEFVTIVPPTKKTKTKDRLYVWGYTGTGALGEFSLVEITVTQ